MTLAARSKNDSELTVVGGYRTVNTTTCSMGKLSVDLTMLLESLPKVIAGVDHTRHRRSGLGVESRIGLVRGCCIVCVVSEGMVPDLEEVRDDIEKGGGKGSCGDESTRTCCVKRDGL